MSHRLFWMIVLLAGLGVGCTPALQAMRRGEAERTPSSEFTHAVEPETPAAPVARSIADSTTGKGLPIGPENTAIHFVGTSLLNKQPGSFDKFDGRLELDSDDPRDARISITIDMDSISTNIGLLTKHLKRADFLDVEHYPEATFVSTKIVPVPGGGVHHTVTGDMTIHGVTKSVEFPARIAIADKTVGLDATIELHQSEFGMQKAAKKTDDVVPVTVSSRLRRR